MYMYVHVMCVYVHVHVLMVCVHVCACNVCMQYALGRGYECACTCTYGVCTGVDLSVAGG